ncbi:MAG: hypothetical protein DWQ31_16825 [Planctomycetota bacterium]|nr:MAG: hypothetical protein DWQ31_16825 [Planctomycetota bacterium]REJ92018.1 MAG: hypothetical protein DWQ35_12775 [Planctomycetota bacterium]REK28554.1 MAG: hypothetical protein DWQ42_04365 [Planctomycetota bacterium]REK39169.1 MAG: hypothetical protein DWQ46_17950 [Planctomycetota bacterium]
MNRYNHDLIQSLGQCIDEPLDREKNDALYARLCAGDADAREEMIQGNMPLVIDKVNSYVNTFPQAEFLQDDMQSAGFLGLVQAVSAMMEHKLPQRSNATGYISVSVQREIGKVVDNELTIRVPDRTKRLKRAQNEKIDAPKNVGVPSETLADDGQQHGPAMFELRDLIETCCLCEEDRVIVAMREQGHSDEEIGQAINVPKTTAYMMRRELYQRFLAKSELKG